MNAILYAAIFIITLCCEAFFSGSEMALISADRIILRKLSQNGNQGAQTALDMLRHPEHLLATTLVGTTLCVAIQAAAATLFVLHHFGPAFGLYATLCLSPIILVFGEILPKTIFQRFSEDLAPRVAHLVRIAQGLFLPLTWILGRYTSWLSRKLQPIEDAITGRHRPTHREELQFLLTYGKKETSLKSSERKMIRRILEFSKAEARNALIPLVNVDVIMDSTSMLEALAALKKFGHSRLPVYHSRVDNIVGVLHAFDLFAEQGGLINTTPSPAKLVSQIMRPAFYVPETQQLDDLLFTMQKRGIQMAIVVDEYGGGVGIVTMEDILEEIVGEIKDEYDEDITQYQALSENEFLIQGKMEIESINEVLKLHLPHGEYVTLAGFLLQQFNRVPEEGDELYYGNLKFVVRKANNRMIKTVQVTRI